MCEEIREFLIKSISYTGGHLASNLGLVELTVSLHKIFNSEIDRIIFDVSHQCYTHKILTGRKIFFHTLRQYQGISGFTNPTESIHDACIAGHASNSISISLGMARARDLQRKKYHVLTIIGDGSFTGGMVYEALNDAGYHKENIIIILNDNSMSISNNVGAITKQLSKLRINNKYINFKKIFLKFLKKIPFNKIIYQYIKFIKDLFKKKIINHHFFQSLGCEYFGPIDGHNIKELCDVFQKIKYFKKPVLIHVKTIKGKGYKPAEKNSEFFHCIGSSISNKQNFKTFSKIFGEEINIIAENNEKICTITAAMPYSTGLNLFKKNFKKRFFDVGIAEEHAVSMCAGLAKQGMIPVCAIYSTFLQRAYDQLIHDIAIDNLHAIFMIDRAGLVGEDGVTHHGIFDVNFIRSIPNFILFAPSNFNELKYVLNLAINNYNCPIAIRYPKGDEGFFKINTFEENFLIIKSGYDLLFITYGMLINNIIKASYILEKKYNFKIGILKINNLTFANNDLLIEIINKYKCYIIVEDVIENGCIGQYISSLLLKTTKKQMINLKNNFIMHGNINNLYTLHKLDINNIVIEGLNLINENK